MHPDHDFFFFKEESVYIGRDWLYHKVREEINTAKFGVFLVAEPGFGKSRFVADMLKRRAIRKDVLVYHICNFHGDMSKSVLNFINMMHRRMSCLFPEVANYWTAESMCTNCESDPFVCFEKNVISTLLKANISENSQLFVVIDGLDECDHSFLGRKSLVDLLAHYYKKMPMVKFFITSRDVRKIISQFEEMSIIQAQANSTENEKDVLKFILATTNCETRVGKQLLNVSGGNMLLANYYSTHIKSCTDLDVSTLPNSIKDMYNMEFKRIYKGMDIPDIDRSFLEVIVGVRIVGKPMTIDLLFDLLKFSDTLMYKKYSLYEILSRLKPHLLAYGENHAIYFRHDSLREWLTLDPYQLYYIDETEGHRTWALYLYDRAMYNHNGEKYNYTLLVDFADRDYQKVYEMIALSIHLNMSQNASLIHQLSAMSKKHPIPEKIRCLTLHDNTECNDHMEIAANNVNDYHILKMLMILSIKSDFTRAASVAATFGNLNSLKAIMEFGFVNLSHSFEIVDITAAEFFNSNYHYQKMDSIPSFKELSMTVSSCETMRQQSTNPYIFYGPHMDNFTTLQVAVANGYPEVLRYLLDENQSLVHQKTKNGWSLFHLAVFPDMPKIFYYLSKYTTFEFDFAFLHFAAEKGSFHIVHFLLQKGVRDHCHFCTDVKSLSKHLGNFQFDKPYLHADILLHKSFVFCETALFVAAKNGHWLIVDLLLLYDEESKTINCKDVSGLTPLAIAILKRHDAVIQTLLSRNADLGFICKSSTTYTKRAVIINNLYKLPEDTPLPLENKYERANIAHLVSLRPSREGIIALESRVERNSKWRHVILNALDAYGRTPMQYALCHEDAENLYNNIGDFFQPRSFEIVPVLYALHFTKYSYLLPVFRSVICSSDFTPIFVSSRNLCKGDEDTLHDYAVRFYPNFTSVFIKMKPSTAFRVAYDHDNLPSTWLHETRQKCPWFRIEDAKRMAFNMTTFRMPSN